MKFGEIINKFRGEKKQRAAAEFGELAKQLASDPSGSINAELVSRILDNAGVGADALQAKVSEHQYRAACRRELAGAEEGLRAAQSARDKAASHVSALLVEFEDAKRAAADAENVLHHLSARFSAHHEFLRNTAPEHLKQRKAELNSRLGEIDRQTAIAEQRKNKKALDALSLERAAIHKENEIVNAEIINA
jgi:hypothetical protein